jgi:chromosome segregation ATPase
MAKGIAESDVHSAADALLAAGERPTIERVRHHLGRGSPNTITGYLNSWFAGLGERLSTGSSAQAAPPDPVLRLAGRIWAEAMEGAQLEAAQALQRDREALALEKEELGAARAAIDAERQQMRVRLQDLEVTNRLAGEQLTATEGRLAAAEVQLKERDVHIRALQHQVSEGERECVSLQHEAREQRAAHGEALRAAQTRHEVHEKRWLVELDGERESVKRLRVELDTARAVAAKESKAAGELVKSAEAALDEARREVARLHAAADSQQLKIDQIASELRDLQAELLHAKHAQREAELANASLQAKVDELRTLSRDLQRQNAAQATRIGSQDAQIAALVRSEDPGDKGA